MDEDAAPVVRLIFQLALEGNGPGKIARILREMEIITPSTLMYERTGKCRWYDPNNLCTWSSKTIVNLLEQPQYLGHTVNFRTTKKSYKSKKKILNSEDKWVVFENTHEALITQEQWDIVQKNRQQRRRPTRMGDMGMFSGLLFCADCGHVMNLNRSKSWKKRCENYTCGAYKGYKHPCTAHYIRVEALEQIVLENLREVISFARDYEVEFVQRAIDNQMAARLKDLAQFKRILEQNTRRITEIDAIIKRLYEDNIIGKLTDERFSKMTADYEREQTALEKSRQEMQTVIDNCEAQKVNIDSFLKLVHKYTVPDRLFPELLNAFVEKIMVHEADKSSGHRVQQIDIHYNFIGEIGMSHTTN